MARSLISSCFCSCVLTVESTNAIRISLSSSSSLAPSSCASPPAPAPLTVVGARPPTREGVCSRVSTLVWFLGFLPRFFLGGALTWLPLTTLALSAEGERGNGEPASGGKEVWRRGWAAAEVTESVEAFRRLADPGGAPSDARFLFDMGSCAGDGYGGECAVGEYEYGGEAIAKASRRIARSDERRQAQLLRRNEGRGLYEESRRDVFKEGVGRASLCFAGFNLVEVVRVVEIHVQLKP